MTASGAGRRWESQLRELILKPPLCYPPLSPGPNSLAKDPARCSSGCRNSGSRLRLRLLYGGTNRVRGVPACVAGHATRAKTMGMCARD
eukprot:9484198-Pyramimonas_sp.AAC.2